MKNNSPHRNFKSHVRIEKNFYPEASALRAHFEKTFADPYRAHSSRFCWDYWSISNQYRLLRTPAEAFFGQALFKPFLAQLLNYGRTRLGCQMISHPWLSAYIDGSFQNLHSDVAHGPYSFVYSLTPWKKRRFIGGETLIAEPKLLRYFSDLRAGESHEQSDLLKRVNPEFNQLTLFDPRYPHGVARVDGVENILESRLVIHGWFTEPRAMFEGSLSAKQVSQGIDQLAQALLDPLGKLPYSGLLSIRLQVERSGKIASTQILAAHLIDGLGQVIPNSALSALMRFDQIRFPKASGSTQITLPLEIN